MKNKEVIQYVIHRELMLVFAGIACFIAAGLTKIYPIAIAGLGPWIYIGLDIYYDLKQKKEQLTPKSKGGERNG